MAAAEYRMILTGVVTAGNVCLGRANQTRNTRAIDRILVLVNFAFALVLSGILLALRHYYQISAMQANDIASLELAIRFTFGFACFVATASVNCAIQGICRGSGWLPRRMRSRSTCWDSHLLTRWGLNVPHSLTIESSSVSDNSISWDSKSSQHHEWISSGLAI